jgi:hypothetical protein
MPQGYSRTVRFDATAGQQAVVELPAPPRGELSRFILHQISGVVTAASFSVYDRKGACSTANDREVYASGAVQAVAASQSKAAFTFTAQHGMKAGDQFEVKGCDVSGYNTKFTVVSVLSATSVLTNVAYTANASAGYWQTLPWMPTYTPVTHLVLGDDIAAGGVLKEYDLGRGYENRDNQSQTMRCRHTALWLELNTTTDDPSGDNSQVWEVSYTVEADIII